MRDFSRSLPMALLRAREAVMDRFRPSLREFGITEQQWRVLRALYGRGEVETGALAGLCCLLTPSLSRILKHLEATGLVVRRPAPSDQRRTLVAIAPGGRRHCWSAGHRIRKPNIALSKVPVGKERIATLVSRHWKN